MGRLSIKAVLCESATGITIRGQNHDDLAMAVTWLRAHDMVKNVGNYRITDAGQHSMRVMINGNRREAVKLVKDRYGSFVNVD